MELTMLGTGHAMVTECYNTCFAFCDGGECFLVDGGGGNGLLRQLRLAGIRTDRISDVFVTHRHTDHVLGIFWLLRALARPAPDGAPERSVTIHSHAEVIHLLQSTAALLFPGAEGDFLQKRVRFHVVSDGESAEILHRTVTFFDLHAEKATQFGFCMELGGGRKLTCCGDEPLPEAARRYAEGSDWLLHEAFCLSESGNAHPRAMGHSTVREACEIARSLGVSDLLLYHTEDRDLPHRKQLYAQQTRQHFTGRVHIPDDLETLSL